MLRKLLRRFRPERRGLLALFGLNLLASSTEAAALMAVAALLRAAVDGAESYDGSVGPFDFELSLSGMASVALGLLVASLVLMILAVYVTARLVSGYRLRSRLAVLRAFEQSSWSVQSLGREGWLLSLSTTNVAEAAQGIKSMSNWIRGAVGLGVFLAGALIVDLAAVLAILGAMGLVVLALRPVNRYARRLSGDLVEHNVRLAEDFATLTSTAREFQVFGVVESASEGFRSRLRRQRQVNQRSEVVQGLTAPVFRSAGAMLIVALVAFAGMNSATDVTAVGLVAVLLYRSFNYGTGLVTQHQRLVQLEPVLDQLDEGVELLRSERAPSGSADPGRIERIDFESVSYRYPNGEAEAVSDLSLSLHAGEVIGVVGPSGAGKSTFAELLLGLREPTAGSIRVNGIDLSDVRSDVRARGIALVSQHVPIIPATISDNIRFFRDIDEAQVRGAVASAGIGEWVDLFDEGLDARIGPGFRAVSGGQAQRIGVARALAGNPAVVVLDEPTSALDASSEKMIIDTIGRLRGSTMVVVIAHRLTTLRHCDRLAVFEASRLVDIGRPDEVRTANSYLRSAYALGRLE